MRARFASIAVLGTVAACGGGSLDPGAGNDAGTGTSTLLLVGSARATPRLVNAREPTDFDVDFDVRVTLNGQTVTAGTITVTSATGKVALTFRGDNNHWTGSAAAYDQVYVLDVISGADQATGVRVDGPDIHVFSQPKMGETVDASLPLMVAWTRSDTAAIAALRAENIDAIAIADSGSYSLAPGALKTDSSVPRPNTLRLTRANRVTPAGAAAGSLWSVSVDNTLDVVAQALPK